MYFKHDREVLRVQSMLLLAAPHILLQPNEFVFMLQPSIQEFQNIACVIMDGINSNNEKLRRLFYQLLKTTRKKYRPLLQLVSLSMGQNIVTSNVTAE